MRFFDWVRRWPLWGFLGLAGGAIAFAWLSSKASTNQKRVRELEATAMLESATGSSDAIARAADNHKRANDHSELAQKARDAATEKLNSMGERNEEVARVVNDWNDDGVLNDSA